MEKKITKKELLQAIENGNYEVKMESECNCVFHWDIECGELIADIDSDCCQVGNILYVAGKPVYQNIQYEAPESLINGLDVYEILINSDYYKILEECNIGDNEENKEHENKLQESLIDWLNESGFDFYIDPERGFGNEYTCLLVENKLKIEEEWESVTAEKWVEMYLEKRNNITKYFIGFRVVQFTFPLLLL